MGVSGGQCLLRNGAHKGVGVVCVCVCVSPPRAGSSSCSSRCGVVGLAGCAVCIIDERPVCGDHAVWGSRQQLAPPTHTDRRAHSNAHVLRTHTHILTHTLHIIYGNMELYNVKDEKLRYILSCP